MKKLIAILLTAALCLSLLPAAAFADNAAFIYNDAEIQDLYYDFEYVSDMVLTHFTNEKPGLLELCQAEGRREGGLLAHQHVQQDHR